jgi:hypothetical protein
MLGVRRNRSSCSATALVEVDAPQGLKSARSQIAPCQNFDAPAWYTFQLNEPALGWQFDSRVTDSEMEQRLTLREALAEDRLAEFVRQEEVRGVELANGSELERALALLITKRRVHVGPLLPSGSYARR